jgi:beta-lactamase class D
MKNKISIALLALFASGCSSAPKADSAKTYFSKKNGCFLLYNVKTNSYEKTIGEENCTVQYPACSTFKVPLAVMGFHSGILKDDKTLFKWNGKTEATQSWMADSVVWYSQVITQKLGEKKLQKYLNDFNYGNKDIKGGLSQAWLHEPDSESPSLKINALEQVNFMRNLWRNNLPVHPNAIAWTKKITYLETSPLGYRLSGKTGSNFFKADAKKRLGWFIGHLQNNDKEYIVVTNFTDKSTPTEEGYGGMKAKEITKQILKDQGIW